MNDKNSTAPKLKAPFPWFGGKSRAASLIWPRLGNPRNYVEPFAGSLAVLLQRAEWGHAIETVNDLDCYLANFWRAVTEAPHEVARYADWPVNECDLHARHSWLVNSERAQEFREAMKGDPAWFDAKIAGWWVWGISQWIGSGWCVHRTRITENSARWQKRPRLGDEGIGVHRMSLHEGGKIPYLDHHGRGVHSHRVRDIQDAARWDRRPALNSGQGVHRRTGGLYEYFEALQERLRRVRVCCGGWERVLRPAVTTCIGETAVLLDPPYAHAERDASIYSAESDVSAQVREWALENGDNPKFKIALCGYEGEHEMPSSWECVAWKANGGYGARGSGRGKSNAHRERIWFSPHCLHPETGLREYPREGLFESQVLTGLAEVAA